MLIADFVFITCNRALLVSAVLHTSMHLVRVRAVPCLINRSRRVWSSKRSIILSLICRSRCVSKLQSAASVLRSLIHFSKFSPGTRSRFQNC